MLPQLTVHHLQKPEAPEPESEPEPELEPELELDPEHEFEPAARARSPSPQLVTIAPEILTRLSSAMGRDAAQERLVTEMCQLLGCDRASIFLLDQNEDELVIFGGLGIRIPRTSGIAGLSATKGEHLTINDPYTDDRFDPTTDRTTGYTTTSIMSTPIRDSTGGIVGVLQAINKEDGGFDHADSTMMQELAVLAGRILTYSVSLHSGQQGDFFQIVPTSPREEHEAGAAEEEEAGEIPSEHFFVACPEGCEAGQLLFVTTPLGHEIQLYVPEGVSAGDDIEVGAPPEDEDEEDEDEDAVATEGLPDA